MTPRPIQKDQNDVTHPVCGKCYSVGVYKDYDADGQPVIACLICGNRYPGGKEGFFMTEKAERQIEKKKVEAAETVPVGPPETSSPSRKMCKTCGLKPTISDSCPLCPSCMRKRSIQSRKGKTAPVRAQRGRPKKDTNHHEKTPTIENMAVNIDFGTYPHVLKQVSDLADQEIRPLDLQIIYLLKRHFEKDKAFPMEV